MAFNSRPSQAKRQRELAQKDKVAERAARRADRKERAAVRRAAGHVGPELADPIAPFADDGAGPSGLDAPANDDTAGDGTSAAGPSPDAAASARQKPTAVSRLYVGNLSFATDADALRELFESAGEVADVQVVIDRDTGRPRGFAFVTMASVGAARKAIAELEGATLDNRQIRVSEAQERMERGGGGGGRGRGRGRF
ncbi:MAG TPA: RNA-binding protein [Kofleriaceae bacterium]|nr:RNA-binding protein [Kofleriaceae bacterium]